METSKGALSARLLESELQRERDLVRRRRRRRIVFGILLALLLLLFAAWSFLAQTLWISGDAMAGTLRDGDIAVGLRFSRYVPGDVVVLRYHSGILVKRLIAQGGDWVEFDGEGRFFVNGALLDEPYVSEFSRGNCDVALPLIVPEGRCFVVGDNRSLSIDSRSSVVGCVEEGTIEGRVLLRIWPPSRVGRVR